VQLKFYSHMHPSRIENLHCFVEICLVNEANSKIISYTDCLFFLLAVSLRIPVQLEIRLEKSQDVRRFMRVQIAK
jgi:hypothetical protein